MKNIYKKIKNNVEKSKKIIIDEENNKLTFIFDENKNKWIIGNLELTKKSLIKVIIENILKNKLIIFIKNN